MNRILNKTQKNEDRNLKFEKYQDYDQKPQQNCSVADPDPGSGAFLTHGKNVFRIPDPKPIYLRA
jgi:hypothetical protein